MFQNTARRNISEHGTSKQHCVKIKLCHSPKRDVGGAVPYILVLWFVMPQNRCALCGGCFAELDSISGAGLCFDFCFVIEEHLVFFFFLSAPLGRLAPIEALPQALLGALPPRPPQWVSPLDPDQGRAPGPFARFARCFLCFVVALCSVWRCHSSLLTPHSSLISAPHSNFAIPPTKF